MPDKTGSRVVLGLLGLIVAVGASAKDACLVTPAELQAATGRTFLEGKAIDNAVDGAVQCAYAEKDKPQRRLIIAVNGSGAKRQFESRMRLLQMGKDPIALAGVGDAAYYNGTSAGVLSGDKSIAISNVRRASDPKIASEKVAELLRAALKRSG